MINPGAPDYVEYVRSSPTFTSVFRDSFLEYTTEKDGLEVSTYIGAEPPNEV